ncbi:MAG: amidohydrolase family protein [Planctomycetales bacterium]|nr:amidohydrolase family protein [Planctomycetales bacterium]
MRTERDSKCKLLPSRREIICGAAGLGATLVSSRYISNAAGQGDWIDAHVHVWTPDTKVYPLADGFQLADMQPPSFTPEQLMAHAKPSGVGRIVLIQMSFYGYDNSYMLAMMERFQGVFAGVAVVDENNEPVAMMKRLAAQGVKGFRIRPGDRTPEQWLTGDGMRAMWQCGAEQGLAMCHLINPEYLPSVAKMCRLYPQTPVVIDHFGRIGVDGIIRVSDLDNLCRLAEFPQVSVKVSAFYALGRKQEPYEDLGAMIKRLLDAFGPERLMWASDCPYQVQGEHTYEASIELVKSHLDFLSVSDRDWILKKTAERVFFA